METLADEIARLSDGRITFDARGRTLRQLLPDGEHVDHALTETELRHRLQRLLFASSRHPAAGSDSRELSVELLVEELDAELAA